MSEIKVGFITSQNETYLMTYDEVNDFCEKICMSDKNIKKFKEFQKKYTYFFPYFDFVMFNLNYIFINPLLEKDTFLMKAKKSLYQVYKQDIEDEQINYDSIKSAIEKKKNGKNYAHLVACSNEELKIELAENSTTTSGMIDPNGYILMSTNDGENYGNHEVTSNTILNQLLIYNKDLWKNYTYQYNSIYLIEKFGFMKVSSIDHDGIMIGIEKYLTDKTKSFKDFCVNTRNCVFYDWTDEKKIINEDIEEYQVRRR